MAQIKEPQQGEAPGEDTNVYVKRLMASRGRTRRPVMILATIAVVLLTLMALKWGSRRHEDLTMMGPVYDTKAGDTVVQEAPPPPAPATQPAQKPTGAPGEVEVNLENGGDLWVDGRELSSHTRKHDLMLAPGPHILTVHQDGRILTQKITVAPNDSLEVRFAQKIKVMRRAD